MSSTVVGSLSLTNMRTPVMPMTPPLAASLRIASSAKGGEHAHLIHRLDDLLAVVADPAIDPFRRTAADQILSVVCQLRTAQTQFVEGFDVLRFSKFVRILQSHDDGDLLLGLRG